MGRLQWVRGGIAGLAGGVAWLVGILLFFGPAQWVLGDPRWQSAKMLAAFTAEPLPRAAEAPWILPLGLLVIGALWGWVYIWLTGPLDPHGRWGRRWWRRGLRFSVLSWALMVPWFQFYLPWNVLREPVPLVLLEMACWTGVLLCVGLTIAGVEHALRPRDESRHPLGGGAGQSGTGAA